MERATASPYALCEREDPAPRDVLAAMRRYAAAGLSVVPILCDGSKKPPVAWKQFQSLRATDDEMRQWAQTGYGIAIVCGAISSNLEVIDNDDASVWPEWCELVESHAPGLLERLVIIRTPSGCNHVAYRCDKISGNQKLAQRAVQDGDNPKLEVLFETRGEGGYIVAPGSPLAVHDEGKPYEFIQGDFDHIPAITPDERDLLLGLARALNEYHPQEEKHERAECKRAEPRAGDDLRPGDDFNERGDPESILLSHGWTVSHRQGSVIFWRKPGKRGRGHQATLHAVARNVFYVFSTSAAPFEDWHSYSPFQVYALLEHNGDFSAAARQLAALGYGSQKPDPQVYIGGQESASTAEATPGRVASELTGREQIICRFLAELGVSDKAFRTYIAVRSIANGRRAFRLSGALLTRHIKIEQCEETDKVYGWRCIDALKSELKRKINFPIFKRLERAQYNPDPRKKSLPAKYRLDETPFDEAEELAATHPAMQPGDGYCPGKAREWAAVETANRYRFGEKPPIEKPEKPSEFQQLKNAEKRMTDALKKIFELLEDMSEPTLEFQRRADGYKVKVDEILLKGKRKSRRKKDPENCQKSTDFLAANDSSQNGLSAVRGYNFVTTGKCTEKMPVADVTKQRVNTLGYTPEKTGWALAGDRPVNVLGWAERAGQWFAQIEGSATGIPIEQIEFTEESGEVIGW